MPILRQILATSVASSARPPKATRSGLYRYFLMRRSSRTVSSDYPIKLAFRLDQDLGERGGFLYQGGIKRRHRRSLQ